MNPRVIALAGPLKGKTFSLTEGKCSIGRDPSNLLCPNDVLISRQHALIRTSVNNVTIIDLNSRNGTFVNAVPVTERKLESGDRIQIGDSLLLFVVEDEGVETNPNPVRFDETVPLNMSMTQLHRDDSLYLSPLKLPAVTERMA